MGPTENQAGQGYYDFVLQRKAGEARLAGLEAERLQIESLRGKLSGAVGYFEQYRGIGKEVADLIRQRNYSLAEEIIGSLPHELRLLASMLQTLDATVMEEPEHRQRRDALKTYCRETMSSGAISGALSQGSKLIQDVAAAAAERRRQAVAAERRRQAEEARRRRQAEEAERRRQAEEAERRRQAEEAERRRQAEEAERRRQAEEAERRRQAEEAERRRQAAAEAERRRQAEEAERRRREAEAIRLQQVAEERRRQEEAQRRMKQQALMAEAVRRRELELQNRKNSLKIKKDDATLALFVAVAVFVFCLLFWIIGLASWRYSGWRTFGWICFTIGCLDTMAIGVIYEEYYLEAKNALERLK